MTDATDTIDRDELPRLARRLRELVDACRLQRRAAGVPDPDVKLPRLARLKAAVRTALLRVRLLSEPTPPPRPPPTEAELAKFHASIRAHIAQVQADDMRVNLNRYQREAMRTAVYPGRAALPGVNYTLVGLAGESGELLNKWKKVLRGDRGREESRDAMAAELADVLWYVAATATELGVGLGDIAAANLAKLADRAARDVVRGDGDHR